MFTMQLKIVKKSYFSIALFGLAFAVFSSTMSHFAIAYGPLFSNNTHTSLAIDKSCEQNSSCIKRECDHITFTHKHASDEDNDQEHDHTHFIHLSHGEFLSLGSQILALDISGFLAVSPLLALAMQPAFFPKVAYASIFRPPIA